MNKLELIQILAKRAKITKQEAGDVVRLFFDEMATSLQNGGRVEIRGFCSFYAKEYKAYMGRNPKTGEKVQIPAKRLPFFKCGKELKELVNHKKNKR